MRLTFAESALKQLRSVERLLSTLDPADPEPGPIASWDNLLRQLERLERYERRARSRRDRAIKEFDRMKTKAMSI